MLTRFTLHGLRVVSEANTRGHWRQRWRRGVVQRTAVKVMVGLYLPPPPPVIVMLTRIAPRVLDDDNLTGGFKAIRDEVAAWLRLDDRPGSGVVWRYAQRRGEPRQYAVIVEVYRDDEEEV